MIYNEDETHDIDMLRTVVNLNDRMFTVVTVPENSTEGSILYCDLM